LKNGYLVRGDAESAVPGIPFSGVDWSKSTAYGVGLNGLYVNQRGREKHGIVDGTQEKAALLKKLTDELLAVRDHDGAQVIAKIYNTAVDYPHANPEIAPDLLIGYARNYRAGWSTLLGDFSNDVIEDNRDRWSGDHCIAADLVPGILVSNRKFQVADADLRDLAPTILSLFGVPQPKELEGRMILAQE
jgi:predicted AlkP superfamily phosphohydrolase/phosphomutase